MKKILPFCVVLIALMLVGCATEITPSDTKGSTEGKKGGSELLQIPEGKMLVSLRSTLHTFIENSEDTVNLIDRFSAQGMSKEDFCAQIEQKEKKIIDMNKELENNVLTSQRLSEDVVLLRKFQRINGWVWGIGLTIAQNLEKVSKFCAGGSITELAEAKKNLHRINIYYAVPFEKGIRSKPGPSDDFEEVAILFDELKETILTEPADLSKEKVVYGIGDTIQKKKIKITLNSVKKNYIHPAYSYVGNDKEWTNKEWNSDIIDYIYAWKIESDQNLKQKISDELNRKYGPRVSEDRLYQYFDYSFKGPPAHLSNRQSTNPIVRLYVVGTEEIETEKYDGNDGYVRGLFYLRPNQRDKNVKLVINFDDCAYTMEEIESVEKNPNSCPQTFIFTVDLSQVDDWKNY